MRPVRCLDENGIKVKPNFCDIVGIDLGTCNSAAAVMMDGIPTSIPIRGCAGGICPSCVAFNKDGLTLVGESAKKNAVLKPEETVLAIKRQMGDYYSKKVYGKSHTPPEISAFVLQKIKQSAEYFTNKRINKAVITVPAYFNENQRRATIDAATIAGLNVLKIINEPTAAGLTYGWENPQEQKVLIVHFGGGTFDVSLMEIGGGVFEVKSTCGDTLLGGIDIDNVLLDHVYNEFKKENGIDLREDEIATQRLREACELAKIDLSSLLKTTINLPFITSYENKPQDLKITITREKLEELVKPVVDRCNVPIKMVFDDAELWPDDIDRVIIIGGPTKMPIVKDYIKNFVGYRSIISFCPSEYVAMGAAIEGGILAGINKNILLLDVTPLSLGIETSAGVFTKLIDRNTTLPTRKSHIFSTVKDNQTSVKIRVFQGERTMAKDNIDLGKFELVGIPPAPNNIPQIEVSFEIDTNGILTASAIDKGTGIKQQITIISQKHLSNYHIERMRNELETSEIHH